MRRSFGVIATQSREGEKAAGKDCVEAMIKELNCKSATGRWQCTLMVKDKQNKTDNQREETLERP